MFYTWKTYNYFTFLSMGRVFFISTTNVENRQTRETKRNECLKELKCNVNVWKGSINVRKEKCIYKQF